MPSLREQWLAAFREDIHAGQLESSDNLFRILYGLPFDLQIELARTMTARSLPIFQVHHPEIGWPVTMLGNLDGYFSEHGQSLPEEPEKDHGGDASFHYCLYGLLDALAYREEKNAPRVTSACCTTLVWATAARARNVWRADDPDAAHALDIGDRAIWSGRTFHGNVASRAVIQREWLIVADQLEALDLASFPDTEDTAREAGLAWWKDRECLL